MTQPVDFMGNPIDVGDTIVWSDVGGGSSMSLYTSVVNQLTDKKVLVAESIWGNSWRPFNCVVVVKKGGK